jgi:hypothetical protein
MSVENDSFFYEGKAELSGFAGHIWLDGIGSHLEFELTEMLKDGAKVNIQITKVDK